jgi:hypothetical protein
LIPERTLDRISGPGITWIFGVTGQTNLARIADGIAKFTPLNEGRHFSE